MLASDWSRLITCILTSNWSSGRLAEEVTDCGPVVDLEASPGCSLVKDGADPKADFPACCPVYDCEEGTEVQNIILENNK